MYTLRHRVVLSHLLPILLITPLMGIVLIYALESQVILANLSLQLTGQARLIADIAADYPQIWSDGERAQQFVDRFNQDMRAQLMLLQPDGLLLAAGIDPNAEPVGERLDHPGLARVRAGESNVEFDYTRRFGPEIIDLLAPAVGPDGQIVGVVRLTHELDTVFQRFHRVRTVVAWVLIPGLLLGILLGLILALTLERPLFTLASAISRMNDRSELALLAEEGPNEIRLVAQAFNTVTRRLQSLEVARRNLLETLVHELGRPLGALRSAIQALQRGAADDRALRRDLFAGMDAEVQRLQRLLEDLSRFYDHAVNMAQLERRPVALHEWFASTVAPWREIALQAGLEWESVFPDPLPTAAIDPDRLGQALGNLLSNAVKYTPPGGKIVTTAHLTEQAILFHVRDTGPGIAAAEQAKIFGPFYRVNADSSAPPGSGLGLTIARDIAVAHGGRVEVTSTRRGQRVHAPAAPLAVRRPPHRR